MYVCRWVDKCVSEWMDGDDRWIVVGILSKPSDITRLESSY